MKATQNIQPLDLNLIKESIREGVKKFIKYDKKKLLENKVNEPTMSHRIAVYLEGKFPGYSVDCEYNKFGNDPKQDIYKKVIRPDIIIHIRGDKTNKNIVLIEIKLAGKESEKSKSDIRKIKNCSNLNYSLGVFIGILKKKVYICWIKDNSEEWEEIKNENK